MNYIFKPRFNMIDSTALMAAIALTTQGRYIVALIVLAVALPISIVGNMILKGKDK